MSILYINTGTNPNAGDGDSIRLAFTKINTNFVEVSDQLVNIASATTSTLVAGTYTLVLSTTGTISLNDVTFVGELGPSGVAGPQGPQGVTGAQGPQGVTGAQGPQGVVGPTGPSRTDQDLYTTSSVTFSNLTVTNTSSFIDVDISGLLTLGQYQGYDNLAIIKNDPDILNFTLRNLHVDSATEINIVDNISGGLTIVHQNSTAASGDFAAGENFIYGESVNDTINIGRNQNLRFFADENWANWSSAVPVIELSKVDGRITVNKDIYSGNIIPQSDNSYDLGVSTSTWRNLWVNYINGTAVSDIVTPTANGTFSTLPDFLEFVRGTSLRAGQTSEGVFFSGNAGNENISYPVRTNFPIDGTVKVVVTLDMVVNDECSDFSICVLDGSEGGIQPQWQWSSNPTRIAASYNCTTPHIYTLNDGITSGYDLPGPDTYRVRFTYDPNNSPNVTLETLDISNTVLDTISINGTLDTAKPYMIGFAADQDNTALRTYIKNLIVAVDGGNTYTDSLQLSGVGSNLFNQSLNTTDTVTFSNLTVTNTASFIDVSISGLLNLGQYQGYDNLSIIKNDPDILHFTLRNLHVDSATEINIVDNISGGLTIVHQNSTAASGDFAAGENFIYGESVNDTINIGRNQDLKFFADENWANWSSAVPIIDISRTDGRVTVNKDIYAGDIIPNANDEYDLGSITNQWRSLYVSTATIYIGGIPLTMDTTTSLVVNGNPVVTYSSTSGNFSAGGVAVQGARGPQGPAGSTGARGPQGPQGVVGPQGPSGAAGSNGAQGPQGPTGIAGAQGPQGPSGAAGSNGAQGPQGPQGPSGSNGSNGPQGPSGVAGPQGPQGPGANQTLNTSSNVTFVSVTTTNLILNGQITTPAGSNANLVLNPDGLADVIITTATQILMWATNTAISTTTGALVVTGGVGVGDNVYVANTVTARSIVVNGQPTTYGYVNGSYLFAVNNADQVVGQNGAVNFQTTSSSNGSLINKISNSQITLTGGNTYKLKAVIGRLQSNSTWAQFKWYDVTNSAYVGAEGFSEVVNSSGAIGSTNVPTAYVTPSVNTTYELRQTTVNSITVNAYASMEVTQVNPTIAVQATATGTVNTNYARYTRSAQQTGLSNGSVVVCNVLDNSSGSSISVNTSSGQVTLTAGKTYKLTGMVPNFTISSGDVRPQFCWYNETASAYIGNSAAAYTPSSGAGYGSFGGAAEAIITANATTVVSFRLLSGASGLAGIGGNTDFNTTGSYPWIYIQEISTSFALNALDTMTLTNSITASGVVSGSTFYSSNAVGNEGGEIDLAKAPNSSLTGTNVVIDQYIDRIRFFEAGGTTRGAYIDLSQAAAGVGTLLNNRVSAFVNAGTFVTMDNIKATVTTSGQRGLSLATVSGTETCYISGTYGMYGGANVGGQSAGIALTTSASSSIFSWSFGSEGDAATYILNYGYTKSYRITVMIGGAFNNNMICIERLV